MIAPAKPRPRKPKAARWHERFLEMLPAIRRYAKMAFWKLDAEAREELVAESVANALIAYRRLVDRGKADLAYPTPLAMYGVRQVKAGRRVGGRLNVRDVTSRHCQLAKGVRVGRLDHFDRIEQQWMEILIEDRRAGPAEVAATRIDFADWLNGLSERQRRIAQVLATGESTVAAARQFAVSGARISQMRQELKASWEAFQGQPPQSSAVA
jgi:hypothetical protein